MEIKHALAAIGFCVIQACGGDAQQAAFIEACTSSSNMGEEICDCVADLAQEELSDSGFNFLVASMQGDTAASQQMVGEMTVEEATAAGLFMLSAPANCAPGQ